jgi:hypothetical protein
VRSKRMGTVFVPSWTENWVTVIHIRVKLAHRFCICFPKTKKNVVQWRGRRGGSARVYCPIFAGNKSRS